MLFVLVILGVLTVLFGFATVVGLVGGALYGIGIATLIILVILAVSLVGHLLVPITDSFEHLRGEREKQWKRYGPLFGRWKKVNDTCIGLMIFGGLATPLASIELAADSPAVHWIFVITSATATALALYGHLKARKKLKLLQARRSQTT